MTATPLVLCYHAVSDAWKADLAIAPARLAEHLEHLVGRGYRSASLADIAAGRAPAKAVAVTFDDAFASVGDLALPVLAGLGLTGTVFVPADYPGSGRKMTWDGLDRWVGTPHEDELHCMSWDRLRELQDQGWEIGSHTCAHPRLTRTDDSTLQWELTRSREICTAELGRECDTIAYPYGDYDMRVVEATRAAGYRAAGTLSGLFTKGDALRTPRVGVYNFDDMRRFRLKVSPISRGLRSSRAWAWLDARREGGTAPV